MFHPTMGIETDSFLFIKNLLSLLLCLSFRHHNDSQFTLKAINSESPGKAPNNKEGETIKTRKNRLGNDSMQILNGPFGLNGKHQSFGVSLWPGAVYGT